MAMVSGSTPASDVGSMRLSMGRSYGTFIAGVEGYRAACVHMLVLALALMAGATAAAETPTGSGTAPVRMVVLGDSLSAGLGLSAASAFPVRLQNALKNKGVA